MSNKLYAEELAVLFACGCGNPECKSSDDVAQWFHSKCHPEAALDMKLVDDTLEVMCHDCGQMVVKIAIATRNNIGG